MKAKTIRLSVLCEYCGTALTYKSIENKNKAARHIHSVCLKAEKSTI